MSDPTTPAPKETTSVAKPKAAPAAKTSQIKTAKDVVLTISSQFPSVTTFRGDTKVKMEQEPKVWVPTGILPLDAMMGGGWPSGRISEIFGPEATYKSGLGCQSLEINLHAGNVSMLYDNEQVYDPSKYHLTEFPDQFLYEQANILEDFYTGLITKLKIIAESGLPTAVLWDSMPVTRAKAELEAAVGQKNFGSAAALHSQSIPKILEVLHESCCALIAVNQVRDAMGDVAFGEDPFDTPGGWAMKFYASLRLKVEKRGGFFRWVDDSKLDPDGYYIRATTVKNKLRPPLRKASFPLIFANNVGADPAMSFFFWMQEGKHFASTYNGKYTIEGINDWCYRKDFQRFYLNHFDELLDFFKQKTNFEYSKQMKEAVKRYTELRYQHLLKATDIEARAKETPQIAQVVRIQSPVPVVA